MSSPSLPCSDRSTRQSDDLSSSNNAVLHANMSGKVPGCNAHDGLASEVHNPPYSPSQGIVSYAGCRNSGHEFRICDHYCILLSESSRSACKPYAGKAKRIPQLPPIRPLRSGRQKTFVMTRAILRFASGENNMEV